MKITEQDIEEITQLGMESAPNEICGVLLTRSDAGPRLCMIPNRAENTQMNVEMASDDILDALLEVVGAPGAYPGDLTKELVLWHTHPGGQVGPSTVDVEFRKTLGATRCLVVTIPSGEAVEF